MIRMTCGDPGTESTAIDGREVEALEAERLLHGGVLVDVDHLLVAVGREVVFAEIAHVQRENERGAHHGPQRHLDAGLLRLD